GQCAAKGAAAFPMTSRIVLEATGDLALRIAPFHILPLVVEFLALCERQADLGDPRSEMEVERDEGEPFLLHLADELAQLAPMEEELARAEGVMVEPVARRVRGDVKIMEPEFAPVERGEGVLEIGLSVAQRFHLGTLQDDSGFQGV